MEKELPPGAETYAAWLFFQSVRGEAPSGGIKEVSMYYEMMYEFDRLYEAWKKCRRGKLQKTEVIQFELNLSEELVKLQRELKEKTQLTTIKNGVDYLGFHFYLTDTGKVIRRLRTSIKRRWKRRLKKMKRQYREDEITFEEISRSIASYKVS